MSGELELDDGADDGFGDDELELLDAGGAGAARCFPGGLAPPSEAVELDDGADAPGGVPDLLDDELELDEDPFEKPPSRADALDDGAADGFNSELAMLDDDLELDEEGPREAPPSEDDELDEGGEVEVDDELELLFDDELGIGLPLGEWELTGSGLWLRTGRANRRGRFRAAVSSPQQYSS